MRALLATDGRTPQGSVAPLEAVPGTLAALDEAKYLPGGLGLNKAQAKSLVAGIAVDVPGTCDYLELERWVNKHRSQEKTAAKQKVSGRGWSAAAAAAASWCAR